MTTMISEIYDALKEAGAPDDKARKAAEVLATGDTKHEEVLRRLDRIEGHFSGMEGKFVGLEGKFAGLEGRVTMLTWMLGVNITLTLLVLGRLFIVK